MITQKELTEIKILLGKIDRSVREYKDKRTEIIAKVRAGEKTQKGELSVVLEQEFRRSIQYKAELEKILGADKIKELQENAPVNTIEFPVLIQPLTKPLRLKSF